MAFLERTRGQSAPDRLVVTNGVSELSAVALEEEKRFGEVLWRGTPLPVTESTLLAVGEVTSVPFLLQPSALPFHGEISTEGIRELLRVHIRSRWAHILLDAPDELIEQLLDQIGENRPTDDFSLPVTLPIRNFGENDAFVEAGASLFHFFAAPQAAEIRGEALEAIIQNHPAYRTRLHIAYEYTKDGKPVAAAVFAKADEKRIIIPQKEGLPINLSRFKDFVAVREYLAAHYYETYNDPSSLIPKDQIYIAQMPDVELGEDRYIVLDRKAYNRLPDGSFVEGGFHLHAPLVEQRSNGDIGHDLELSDSEWVRYRIVKSDHGLIIG